jgi:hypothetical protein
MFSVSAESNPTTEVRSATITLTGYGNLPERLITVKQAGLPSLSVTPNALEFAAVGETRAVAITSNVSWTVSKSANAEWLTLHSTAGMNDESLSFTASANPTAIERSADITVSGAGGSINRIVTLRQLASPELSVVPEVLEFESVGSTKNVIVTSNVSWSVSKSSDAEWLTLQSSEGVSNGYFPVTAEANTTGSPRAATITVSELMTGSQPVVGITRTVHVTQSEAAAPPSPSAISVEPHALSFESAGAMKIIIVASNVAWSARCTSSSSSSSSFLTLSPASGSTNGVIGIQSSANTTGATRTDTVIISDADGIISDTVIVTQSAPAPVLSVSRRAILFTKESSTDTIFVTSNVNWTATNRQSWLSLLPAAGDGNDTIVIAISDNTSSRARVDTMLVTGTSAAGTVVSDTVIITQDPKPIDYMLSTSPDSLFFSSVSSMDTVFVTSNGTWSITKQQNWTFLDHAVGSNSDTIIVAVLPNTSTLTRFDTIVLHGNNGITGTVIIKQEPESIVISPSKVILNCTDTTLNIGQTLKLFATIAPDNADNKSVAWTSTNFSVAVIDNNGLITTLASGKTLIIVNTADGNLKDTCLVTVLESTDTHPADDPALTIYCLGDVLTITSPPSELITIYSASGVLLFQSPKEQGSTSISIGHLPKGVLIVRGSSGWTRKVFR